MLLLSLARTHLKGRGLGGVASLFRRRAPQQGAAVAR
jgi:hypothetical protein